MNNRIFLIVSIMLVYFSAAALECKDCSLRDFFQPTAEQMKNADRSFSRDDTVPDSRIERGNLIVDGVPYSRYWQLGSEKFVFHPMVFGRYIFENSDSSDFRKKLPEIIDRVSVALPNGGTAFYYPNHYPLNRMKGIDIVYSAISQSEILAGVLKYHKIENTEYSLGLLNSVKNAMFFSHDDGGVDLGVAQLEIPLYRSNPEIILNGWLHALLHLNDYAHIQSDPVVAEYVRRNLRFFADNHFRWYDELRAISRYSDTSPHRLIITAEDINQDFFITYDAKDPRIKNYKFRPILDLEKKLSAFDLKITDVRADRNQIIMSVTCSSLFDTNLVSSKPFVIKVRDGGYDPMRASPDGSGSWREIVAVRQADKYVAKLELSESELICGYPTNFSKQNKKNFYHVHHIVSLLYLSKDSAYNDVQLNEDLRSIAMNWYRRTGERHGDELVYEDPQVVIESINRGKVRTPFTRAGELGLIEAWR